MKSVMRSHLTDPADWVRRKAGLNHQLLANDLIINLASYAEESACEQAAVLARKQAAWKAVFAEVEDLLESVEEAMSPRHLFNRGLLGALPEDFRRQSGDMAHADWLVEENIAARKQTIRALLDEGTAYFQAIDNDESASSMKLPGPYSRLVEVLSELSKNLSALPNRLMLP